MGTPALQFEYRAGHAGATHPHIPAPNPCLPGRCRPGLVEELAMDGLTSWSTWDIQAIRDHFDFPSTGRVVTNNAASTQPPRELLALHQSLVALYENVHRGQSSASQHTTRRFEHAYDNIARFVGARS